MTNGWNFFDQLVNKKRGYENIQNITTGSGNDHTTSCLLDYTDLIAKKLTAIDLSKQEKPDTDPKSHTSNKFHRKSRR